MISTHRLVNLTYATHLPLTFSLGKMGNKQGGLTHDGGQPYATNEVVGTAFPSPPSPISPGDIGGPKEYERKSVTGTPSQIAMQRRLSMSIAEFAKQLDTGKFWLPSFSSSISLISFPLFMGLVQAIHQRILVTPFHNIALSHSITVMLL